MSVETVPDVVFKTRVRDESIGGENPFRWQDVTTDDLFKGKKVVVFPARRVHPDLLVYPPARVRGQVRRVEGPGR